MRSGLVCAAVVVTLSEPKARTACLAICVKNYKVNGNIQMFVIRL